MHLLYMYILHYAIFDQASSAKKVTFVLKVISLFKNLPQGTKFSFNAFSKTCLFPKLYNQFVFLCN